MKPLALIFTVSFIFVAPSTRAASTPGHVVKEVLPSSTFEKIGIKKGDRILSYDGQEVNSVSDSMELYDKLKKKSVKTIVIERNGQKQTITVP